jgi:hypothetical protein
MADQYAIQPQKPPQMPQQPVNNQGNLDAMRRRLQSGLQQRQQTELGQANEALNRKLTSQGIQNSGAGIKLQQQQADSISDRFGQQINEGMSGIDQLEFQAGEAEKGRLAQRGMFDEDLGFKREGLGLERQKFLGQSDLANRELGLKQQEQEWNLGSSAKQQGYGVNLESLMPSYFVDSAGRVINPSGQGTGAPANSYFQSPEYLAMQRRAQEEEKRRTWPSGDPNDFSRR